jgi:hypothetical protein
MKLTLISVISYDGYKGGERPTSFSLAGQTVAVVKITTMHIEENRDDRFRRRYFQAKGSDGQEYTLVEDERTRAWYVME